MGDVDSKKMNPNLIEGLKNTQKAIQEDKFKEKIEKKEQEVIENYKNNKKRKAKSFCFSLLMFLFGASCILNYYQIEMFKELFFSPVK